MTTTERHYQTCPHCDRFFLRLSTHLTKTQCGVQGPAHVSASLRYYERNRETVMEKNRERAVEKRAADPEAARAKELESRPKYVEKRKQVYQEKAEERRAAARAWYAANRERALAGMRARREAMKAAKA
jgi:hypothetical protein